MAGIKHIIADMLSEEEMEHFSESFDRAEKRMDEKMYGEIDAYNRDPEQFRPNASGIWLPGSARGIKH
ncbi:MAG: hypothetical protein K6C13_12090 [Oscillospiraceae bacterium]|nr:hypothetical protein [Oscillospiraceae bacterium]